MSWVGVDVIYHDTAFVHHDEVAHRCNSLEELLGAADVVSIHSFQPCSIVHHDTLRGLNPRHSIRLDM
jgi:hypothetical protein